jgi:hypothetical protein
VIDFVFEGLIIIVAMLYADSVCSWEDLRKFMIVVQTSSAFATWSLLPHVEGRSGKRGDDSKTNSKFNYIDMNIFAA